MTSDEPAQGWRRAYDHGQTGQFYYYNAASQRSSWSMPSGESLRRSVEPLTPAALLDIEKMSLRGGNQQSNRHSPGRILIANSSSSSSSFLSRVQKLKSSGRALPSSSSPSNTSSISSVVLAQQQEKRQRLPFCGERGIVHRGEKQTLKLNGVPSPISTCCTTSNSSPRAIWRATRRQSQAAQDS